MVVRASWLLTVLVALLAAWLIWLVLLWRPSNQVELHTLNLLARASGRDWPAVEAMMSPDYRDVWGHDRSLAIDEARRLFSHFFALQIVALAPPRISANSETYHATAPIGVVWRKAGIWPWQWTLAEVRHKELAGRWPR
jgi:hypothetical protein